MYQALQEEQRTKQMKIPPLNVFQTTVFTLGDPSTLKMTARKKNGGEGAILRHEIATAPPLALPFPGRQSCHLLPEGEQCNGQGLVFGLSTVW